MPGSRGERIHTDSSETQIDNGYKDNYRLIFLQAGPTNHPLRTRSFAPIAGAKQVNGYFFFVASVGFVCGACTFRSARASAICFEVWPFTNTTVL